MVECHDIRCPTHGSIKVRGNVFVGKVKSMKPSKTVSIMRVVTHYVPKFERYRKVKSVVAAHKPDCMQDIHEGDVVRIGETRRLSKTKAFVVLGKETGEAVQ